MFTIKKTLGIFVLSGILSIQSVHALSYSPEHTYFIRVQDAPTMAIMVEKEIQRLAMERGYVAYDLKTNTLIITTLSTHYPDILAFIQQYEANAKKSSTNDEQSSASFVNQADDGINK